MDEGDDGASFDGFGDALDGYYDAANGPARYLRERADGAFADARTERRAVDDREAFEARRERLRERFLSAVGGLPERPADPTVEARGRVDRDGYAVERLLVESPPGVRMPANCYVPEGEGPFPGVLLLAGHVDDPRVDAKNQKVCVELAANGFVVLLADPICQGERRQYLEDGAPRFDGDGGVFGHCLAGQRCFYAGANLARYMVHDDRRGLDYLVGRSDVDAERIGVTGTSGGGTRTLYLGLVDDRPDAFAPCCTVTTRREWLKTGKRIDAEQALHGAIPRGMDYADLLAAAAPDPVLVGAAAWDEYFPVEGVHESVERARRVFDLYDGADLELAVADAPHCSVYELREDVVPFLCDRLDAGEYAPVADPTVLEAADLQCTSTGNVLTAFDDERSVEDLIRQYVAERYPKTAESTVDPETVDPTAVRRAVVEALDLDREGAPLYPRFVGGDADAADLTVDRVWFRTERDPDAAVAGVLARVPAVETDAPAVVCYDEGTTALPERSGDLANLAREHGAALAFDPRGVGAVRNREIPIPAWVESYDGIYGTEFKLAYDALLLGTSLLGLRTFDAVRAVEWLREETGADAVSLVGEGVGAYHALYAAVTVDDVVAADLRDLGPGFATRATDHELRFDPALTAVGVCGDADVGRALAALSARDVDVTVSRAE